MTDNLGEPTRDLISTGYPHPLEEPKTDPGVGDRERLVQRFGRKCCIAGAALVFGPIVAVAYVAVVSPHLTGWPDGLLVLSLTILVASMTAGGVFLSVGFCEMLARYNRSLSRRALKGVQDRDQMVENIHDIAESFHTRMAALERTVAERLTGVEQAIDKVPDYGAGVIDGATMRQAVVGEGH